MGWKVWLVGLVLLGAVLLAGPALLTMAAPPLEGANCTGQAGTDIGGLVASDHSLFSLHVPASQPGAAGTSALTPGCELQGNQLEVDYFGPNATVHIAIEQFEWAQATNTTYVPPTTNDTYVPPSLSGNVTTPGHWVNESIPGHNVTKTYDYRASPIWGVAGGTNLTLALHPYTPTATDVTLPTVVHEHVLSVCYLNACLLLYHITPAADVSVPTQNFASLWTFALEFSAVLGIAFTVGAVGAVKFSEKALAIEWSKRRWIIAAIAPAAYVYYLWFTDYWSWELLLGSVGTFAIFLVPEAWLFFLLILHVTKERAQTWAPLQLLGRERDFRLDLNLPQYKVFPRKAPLRPVWVTKGLVDLLARVVLGEKAYGTVDDQLLTPHPHRYSNGSKGIDVLWVCPAGMAIQEHKSKLEWFTRDAPPPRPPAQDYDESAPTPVKGIPPPKAAPPPPGALGRRRLVRYVPPSLRVPAFGEKEARNVILHAAGELSVSALETDRQGVQNQLDEITSDFAPAVGRQARESVATFLTKLARGHTAKGSGTSQAMASTLAEIHRELEATTTLPASSLRGP